MIVTESKKFEIWETGRLNIVVNAKMKLKFKILKIVCITGATTENLPPGALYRVKASYKYQAEDVDELNFEVGEVIDVVEYDDSEDQVWLS